ncbi:MAG TPA: ABC transporter permease [Gemmatimonadales bacterium]|nr:ABC transporter permease [Gemmatimonadales bacterium]
MTERPGRLLAPGLAWLALFFAAPLLMVAAYSVMPAAPFGGVARGFTLAAYARLADPLYAGIVWRTLWLATVTTLVSLLLGYPVAYVIARSGRWRRWLLLLVVLPFWTSFLVRTYAMIFLLRDTGLVNTLLLKLGLIQAPLTLLYTPGAVLAGLVYGYLPFAVLPIYAALEKLDPTLLEAATTLGAPPRTAFFRVTLPLSMPGVVAAALLVFIPSLGSFLTPDLLGGAKTSLLGNLIQAQFTTARDWPFGSAASLLLLLGTFAALVWHLRRRDAGPDPLAP